MKSPIVHSAFVLVVITSLAFAPCVAFAAPEAAAPAASPKPVKAVVLNEAELLKAAVKADKAGETKTAVVAWEAAHDFGVKKNKLKPGTVLSLAKAYDADKRHADALAKYGAYVELASKGPNANAAKAAKKDLDAASARIAELEAMKPKLVITGTFPEGSLVTVDGTELKGTETQVAPGPHAVKVTKDGYEPLETNVTVPVATDTAVALTLKALPPPLPPPAPVAADPLPPKVAEAPVAPAPKPAQDRTAAYVTGSIALLAAGTGTAFGLMALSQKSDFDSTPTKAIADRGENYTLVADMSFGLALTFGLTSAVLFLTDDEEPAAKSSFLRTQKTATKLQVRPVPMVAPGIAGAGATFRF